MGLPRLTTCCFVLDLKTGNIVLGCINAVFSFILMVVMIAVASAVGTLEEAEAGAGGAGEAGPPGMPGPSAEPAERAELTGLYVMSIILVLMFLAKFAFDVFFVYGVAKERASIIKSYLIMWIVFFLLSLFTFFMNVAHYSTGTICTELFYIGLNIYAILLSHSFYKQLNEREEI